MTRWLRSILLQTKPKPWGLSPILVLTKTRGLSPMLFPRVQRCYTTTQSLAAEAPAAQPSLSQPLALASNTLGATWLLHPNPHSSYKERVYK